MRTTRFVRRLRPWLLRVGAAAGSLVVLYGSTLLRPEMLFAWSHDGASIHVRSDEPVPDSAARVIALAQSRIRRSPLFDTTRKYPVYVCNSRWRWNYFSGFDGRVRGFQTPLGRAVFLRQARWDRNRLAGPDGRDGPRPLDVYVAHEVTHMLVADRIGVLAERRLPVWIREGYAEYVARRGTFDYAESRAEFLSGHEAFAAHDRYRKYLLFVAHLLDREGMDVMTVLGAPPKLDHVEARVRAGVATR